MTDQMMRRSSRAVNAMIAEAWARRMYPAAFVNKIDEALGEAMETQAWLDHAFDCGYLDGKEYRALDDTWQRIGAMLSRMIQRADDSVELPVANSNPAPSSILNRPFSTRICHRR